MLLLDEPTNHLDREGRAWLLDALRQHRGIGVIVSHDRALLEQLTTQTLRLGQGQLDLYAGAYGAAQLLWERQAARRRDERRAAVARVDALGQRVQHMRAAQRGAAANKRASERMKDRHDSDARGVLARTRADWADSRHGRSVQVLGRELARAQQTLAELRIDKPLGSRVFAEFVPAPSARLGFVPAQLLCAGDRPVLSLPALSLQRDDRVWLNGPNGSGKSTLLRLLAEQLSASHPDLLVMPQELSPSRALGLLSALRELAPDLRGRVLNIVAGLGVDPDRLLISAQPSPGEARKLLLALGFAKQARVLILDEPENHLDLPAVERLEAGLGEYPGALYLVTHDEKLAQRCTSQVYRLVPTSGPAQLVMSSRGR
jgi:ATPase subunit of ABC transporter with duplicated ATPase domains